MTLGPRDGTEIEALVTDRYLESLLASLDRRRLNLPTDLDLDPRVRLAAARLSIQLSRVHPSFRFEERLATRLAEQAARLTHARNAQPAGASSGRWPDPASLRTTGDLEPFDPLGRLHPLRPIDPLDPLDALGPIGPGNMVWVVRRPLVIGGTIASAALSIAAGAAFLAWRLRRPSHPMARAVRIAHLRAARARLA